MLKGRKKNRLKQHLTNLTMPETGGFRGVSMLMLHNNVNGPFLLRRRRLTKSLLKKNVMFMLRIWCRALEF